MKLDNQDAHKQVQIELEELERVYIERHHASESQQPDSFIDWPLEDLNGYARLHIRGNDVNRVTFTLPRGRYVLAVNDREREDGMSRELIRVDGQPYDLALSPPIRSGEIAVTGENNVTETVPLE